MMRTPTSLLITGGAGFIGSNFLYYLLKAPHRPKNIVVLDALTYAGDKKNIEDLILDQSIQFVHGDIRNKELVQTLFRNHSFDGVIHFAAESHVDNSIHASQAFIETNILGTHNLLESSRDYWSKYQKDFCFLQISTDEVYGQLGSTGFFVETSPLKPRSPYSASKAGGDLLALSWHSTYGFPVIVTRCSNNYGPRQHKEKFIPVVITKALSQMPIPIYGTGQNVRDWIHVDDHNYGVWLAFTKGQLGELYCFGGEQELSNKVLATKICLILDEKMPLPQGQSYKNLLTHVDDRLGHDFRYAIHFEKAQKELGFHPQISFDAGLRQTIDWYVSKHVK